MLKPPTFKQSRDTQIVYGLFREITHRKDPVVTWNELCEATGKPKHKIRGSISTAIERCRRDDGIVIDGDRTIGYRWRKDGEIGQSSGKHIERNRKSARVGLEKIRCVDRQKLTFEERVDIDVKRTVLEMEQMATRPRTIANTKQMVMRKQNTLDEQEQLQAIADALAGK